MNKPDHNISCKCILENATKGFLEYAYKYYLLFMKSVSIPSNKTIIYFLFNFPILQTRNISFTHVIIKYLKVYLCMKIARKIHFQLKFFFHDKNCLLVE